MMFFFIFFEKKVTYYFLIMERVVIFALDFRGNSLLMRKIKFFEWASGLLEIANFGDIEKKISKKFGDIKKMPTFASRNG